MTLSYFRGFVLAVFSLSVVSLGVQPSFAQNADPSVDPGMTSPVRVGVYASPPFVISEEDGRFTGMAVELWEGLADTFVLQTEYLELNTLGELVDAAADGQIDVAVTNLTITRERAVRIDFTHPWFDAGLRIMVDEDQGTGLGAVINGLSQSGYLRAYGWIGLVILLATLLLTVFDRHFDKDFPKRWKDGIAESFYAVMSITTSGRSPARKNLFGWIGRLWQGLWLVCGIAVLAYVTSSVTSVMTTLSLSNQINSVADLSTRTVGVFEGSVAEQYARQAGLDARSFAHIEQAADSLVDGQIAAIIGDAPVLEYFANNDTGRSLAVVGAIFEPDKYGFGLPLGSPLARRLTIEIIGAHESGDLDELRAKYFGNQ